MENGRRKIRLCMAGIVLAAVLVGFLYYYFGRNYQPQNSEGTLVWESGDRQIRLADRGKELQRVELGKVGGEKSCLQAVKQFTSKEIET